MTPEQQVANAIMTDAGYTRFDDRWVRLQPPIPRCANTLSLAHDTKRPTFRIRRTVERYNGCSNLLIPALAATR